MTKRSYPSGAAKRKAKRQKLRKAAARRSAGPQAEVPLERQWLDALKALGPPPKDTVGRIEWGNRVVAQLLHETIVDPGIAPSDRRRVGSDLVYKLSATGVKALYEERLKKLEAKVYGRSKDGPDDDGLDPVPPEEEPRSA